MIYIISKIPTHQDIGFLDNTIYEHNSTTIKKNNGKLFLKWIYDSKNNIIAGIAGWTWASACEITLLWVKKTERRKGFGKILLDEAVIEAKKEKCESIFLRTYTFQVPSFIKDTASE